MLSTFKRCHKLPHIACEIKSDFSAAERPLAVTRMWPGGPLRNFSKAPYNHSHLAYKSSFLAGFVGGYVCERCRRSVAGVFWHGSNWLCDGCRSEPLHQLPIVSALPSDSRVDELVDGVPLQATAVAGVP